MNRGTGRLASMFVAILLAQFIMISFPLSQANQDWRAMIPAIRHVLKREFREVEEFYPIQIEKTADVTGDGVAEALVYFGAGGASTGEMTVMRIEHKSPVLALFKGRDGKVSPAVFAEGASVMHTNGIELLPRERAVLSIHYDYDQSGRLHECGGEAYRWNPRTKVFDFDSGLTERLTTAACRKVPRTVK